MTRARGSPAEGRYHEPYLGEHVGMVEARIQRWLRDCRQKGLEEEVERYYSSLTRAEEAEDSEWAGLASRALGETWK